MTKRIPNPQQAAVIGKTADNLNQIENDSYFQKLTPAEQVMCKKWLADPARKNHTPKDFYELRTKAVRRASVLPPMGTPDSSGVIVGHISREEAGLLHDIGNEITRSVDGFNF
jgi:hypothetical protein